MPGTVLTAGEGGAGAGAFCVEPGTATSKETSAASGRKKSWRCDFTKVPEKGSSTTGLLAVFCRPLSAASGGNVDRGNRLRDDGVDPELSKIRTRPAGIAVDARC